MTTPTNERTKSRINKPTDFPGVMPSAFDKRHLQKLKGRDMRYRRCKRFVDWCQAVELEMDQLDAWEIEGYLDDLTITRGRRKGGTFAITVPNPGYRTKKGSLRGLFH